MVHNNLNTQIRMLVITYYAMPGINRQKLKGRAQSSRVISPDRVLFIIRHYFDVDDLTHLSRRSEDQKALQIGMYLLKKLTTLTLREILLLFGKQDHSRAHHNVHKVAMWVETYPEYRNIVNEIESLI